MGLYQSLVRRIGASPWLPKLVAPTLQRVDTAMLHHGWHVTPFPTLLLTTIGRHSGDPHESPLWFIRSGEDFVVIASNYGRSEPDWSLNLRSDPMCRLRDGKEIMEAVAEQATGDDREELVDRFTDFYPAYREYIGRANRNIPVWRLHRR